MKCTQFRLCVWMSMCNQVGLLSASNLWIFAKFVADTLYTLEIIIRGHQWNVMQSSIASSRSQARSPDKKEGRSHGCRYSAYKEKTNEISCQGTQYKMETGKDVAQSNKAAIPAERSGLVDKSATERKPNNVEC